MSTRLCASSKCENLVEGRRIFCNACSNRNTKSKRAVDPMGNSGLTRPKWVTDAIARHLKRPVKETRVIGLGL